MLDALFNPILALPPWLSILLLSFFISLLIVVVYRLMTNQQEMKDLKDQLKDYQKKMKEHKDNTEKLLELQKEAMSVNMKYMGKSMKPTFVTFIPIILIFSWMSGHFAYEPLSPNTTFMLTANLANTTGNVSISTPSGLSVIGDSEKPASDTVQFSLKGEPGEYYATLDYNGEKKDKKVIISETIYAPVEEAYKDSAIERITLSNKPLTVLFGLSWIWIYLIFAIVFSTVLRRLLKVH